MSDYEGEHSHSHSQSNSTTEISSANEEEFGDPYSFSTTFNGDTTPIEFYDASLFNPKYAHQIAQMATEFLHECGEEANWSPSRLIDQPGRLEVATSTLPYAPFCFRLEAELAGCAEAAFALMHNLHRRPEWDDMCESLKVIEQVDPFTFIYHIKLKARWPTSARDSCSLVGFRKLLDGRFLSVAQSLEDARCPVDESGKVVRMSTRLSGTLFAPLPGNRFHLTQLIDADPKGFIPSALVQRVSSKSFPLTMERIEAAIAGDSGEGYYAQLICNADGSLEGNDNDKIIKYLKKLEEQLNYKSSNVNKTDCLMKWLPLALTAANTVLLLMILRNHSKK